MTQIEINQIDNLVEILNQIPQDSWKAIVQNDPEWKYIGSFHLLWKFGRFSVLMMMIGLNAYQLKGKAEQHYWKNLQNHLMNYPTPSNPRHLKEILVEFYQKERLSVGKLCRIDRFLSSNLANKIWKSNPEYIEENFQEIWSALSKVMNQKPHTKTICFSMKCLAISLYIHQKESFDFSCIPIPVDSRVEKFSEKIGLLSKNSTKNIQEFWNIILKKIQKNCNAVTMIHLDSLIWQIAGLNNDETIEYFNLLNLHAVGEKIITYFEYLNR